MRYILNITTLFLSFNAMALQSLPNYTSLADFPLSASARESILANKMIVHSHVEDSTNNAANLQKLDFHVAGLHSRDCKFAMRKLSQYESYKHFLTFVKDSAYDENQQRVKFLLSHQLLPYDMILSFNLPRIKGPGAYPFSFDKGILKNLTGVIHLAPYQNRCLIYTSAQWQGPHTKIPNFLFELFSSTLSRLSMEHLFRLSGI